MHSDLPAATKLRGYVQLATSVVPGTYSIWGSLSQMVLRRLAVDKPHYLGPVILARGKVAGLAATLQQAAPRPVRIKFYNLLPPGVGGNLWLPVDETVPGSGLGTVGTLVRLQTKSNTQNRATVHLHGNNTVWISDGNTHQWITPASEQTPYPAGVSARNVPDMGNGCDAFPKGIRLLAGLPGAIDPATLAAKSSGCMTLFYTNAQSARLQFYHDHSHGITRLNVYAGEAAGYVVTDAVEDDMIAGSNVTGVKYAGAARVSCQASAFPWSFRTRPSWTPTRSTPRIQPGTGDGRARPVAKDRRFVYLHVYMTVQNPGDVHRNQRLRPLARTAPGSTRLPRCASMGGRWDASRSAPAPKSWTISQSVSRILRTLPARRRGSRRSDPVCRIPPYRERVSLTRRS